MRLFFGLSLPEAIRGETARLAALAKDRLPGRYTSPDNHHLTLAFLGGVAPERVQEAADVLARCARAYPAPRVTLTGLAFFGRPENAILTLAAESAPALAPLNAALRAALGEAGLPCAPGPFSPHVTLARHARISESLSAIPFLPVSFTAPQAHLFLSARDEANILRYTPISAAPFADSGM